MKYLIWLLTSLLPLFLNAQTHETDGIRFNHDLSWKQIREKAKAENKYIFLDCFTTWCGPCKRMDSLVYTSKEVGDTFNNRFISVKVQMDKTEQDDAMTRLWYEDAGRLNVTYAINAYPCFLFFSPDGMPAHKAIGYRSVSRFIALADDAQRPDKQLYTIARNFQPGQLDTAEMKDLTSLFYALDKKLAGKIGVDYLNRVSPESLYMKENLIFMTQNALLPEIAEFSRRYTEVLPEKKLYNPDVLELLAKITTSTNNRGFSLFYRHSRQVDAIIDKRGFGERTADNIIYATEIKPLLKVGFSDTMQRGANVPDFEMIERNIKKKYNKSSSERLVLRAKIDWFGFVAQKYNTHWEEYSHFFAEQMKKDGPDSTVRKWNVFSLNNVLWKAFFLHSTNQEEILLAAACMGKIVQGEKNPDYRSVLADTYANLLYKAGKRDEAIEIESNACELYPKGKSYKERLASMKKGEPTWPVQ